jgi:hypothetical protein
MFRIFAYLHAPGILVDTFAVTVNPLYVIVRGGVIELIIFNVNRYTDEEAKTFPYYMRRHYVY